MSVVRRQTRLRKEYLYRKSLEGMEKSAYERKRLIRTALVATHGRRMEAAQRLGIGRNTITRKIQELGLDAPDEA